MFIPPRSIPCLLVLLVAGHFPTHHAIAQPDAPLPGLAPAVDPAAADQTGHCVRYLLERARLLQARADTLEPLLSRNRAVDSAMSVLSLPMAQSGQAREMRLQALELDEQIDARVSALQGRPAEDQRTRPLDEIRQEIKDLLHDRMRKALLARSYEVQGRARVAMLDQLRIEKQALTDRMSEAIEPYDRRVRWLSEEVRRHDDAFKQAMHGFGRLGELGGISIQAVRVHAMISEGRLTFSWTDAKGSIVASAILKLSAHADRYHQPPFVLDRYPVVLQARQEAQIIAGHFLIEFRVGVDELAGEGRVLDTVTRLLDIDGLGRLVPRLGNGGLD